VFLAGQPLAVDLIRQQRLMDSVVLSGFLVTIALAIKSISYSQDASFWGGWNRANPLSAHQCKHTGLVHSNIIVVGSVAGGNGVTAAGTIINWGR
jgi:hypothetical protein